ncbi:MAG: class I SAM-dependent methyltransferase [Alphaproteobacteria bacterium]|nr:class I SAM-dependent methyltransferase [Alphaproteobacteria bacterium]
MKKIRDHHKTNLDTYDREAKTLAQTYNALATDVVLPGLDERLPHSDKNKRRRALDLGCGSGRDAFWLANERGFAVTAVDGSAAMLAQAAKLKSHPRVQYMKDTLPALEKVRKHAERTHEKYDVILLSAVWMHLDEDERKVLMTHIAALANPKALVYISLRNGPAPADRPMFATEAAEVKALGRAHRARFEVIGTDDDKQGRGGVKWEYVALKF